MPQTAILCLCTKRRPTVRIRMCCASSPILLRPDSGAVGCLASLHLQPDLLFHTTSLQPMTVPNSTNPPSDPSSSDPCQIGAPRSQRKLTSFFCDMSTPIRRTAVTRVETCRRPDTCLRGVWKVLPVLFAPNCQPETACLGLDSSLKPRLLLCVCVLTCTYICVYIYLHVCMLEGFKFGPLGL